MGIFNILKKTQQELKDYCAIELFNNGYTDVDYQKGYLYAKGDIPILLVAHLDTVHRATPKSSNLFYDSKKGTIWCPTGVGGDDRCGVFAILELIKEFKPHILFCEDEEIGATGANLALNNLNVPEVKFIIELDRRGADDCVFYDCNNEEFHTYIQTFGFEKNFGSFSDISIFSEEWDIASVNLSIGYYNEHSFTEYINIKDTYKTIDKVKNILKNTDDKFYDFQPRPPVVINYLTDPYRVKNDYVFYVACDYCFEEIYHKNIIEYDGARICQDCFDKYYN